jgi:hypothetical protein
MAMASSYADNSDHGRTMSDLKIPDRNSERPLAGNYQKHTLVEAPGIAKRQCCWVVIKLRSCAMFLNVERRPKMRPPGNNY